MNPTLLEALLNDIPAIVEALREAGNLTAIGYAEFQEFNNIVTMAKNGELTSDYLNQLDSDRQSSYENTMKELIS